MIALNTKNKVILGSALGGALILFLLLRSISGDSSESKSAQYFEVKKQDLHISVTESGTLESVNNIAVTNQLPGQSKIIFITPEGSRVNKGDLIVKLDTVQTEENIKNLELEIIAAKSELSTATNNLLIEKSTVDSEVRAAQKAITFAKMDLEKFIELDKQQQLRNAETTITQAIDSFKIAEQKFEWSNQLADKGFETKSQVDRDELDVKSKEKSLETAKSQQKMLKLYDLPKQEAQLKSEVTESEKKHTRVIKQGESKISRSEASLASSKNKLKLNVERLEKLNSLMDKASIHAPASGLILYARGNRFSQQSIIEEGATLQENRTIINIPNSDQMKVEVLVPEFHINKVKRDQSAVVTIDSIPNKTFTAKILKVAVLPESGGWLSSGEKNYKVDVLINEALPNVKPSVSAKCDITINHLEDVISVPLQALKEEKGKLYCFIKRSGEDEKVEVTIGLMNNSFVEIKSGLSEGDEVLLTQPAD